MTALGDYITLFPTVSYVFLFISRSRFITARFFVLGRYCFSSGYTDDMNDLHAHGTGLGLASEGMYGRYFGNRKTQYESNPSEPNKNSKASFDRYGREDRYQHESLIPPVFFIDGIRISTVRYVQQRKLPRQPAVFQFPFDRIIDIGPEIVFQPDIRIRRNMMNFKQISIRFDVSVRERR